VVPRDHLVVAVTSSIVTGNEAAPLDFLYADILPALH
jgi:hypothetical protein